MSSPHGKDRGDHGATEPSSRRGGTLDDQIIGVPWFSRSQWKGLQRVSADPCLSDKSYAAWRREAKSVLAAIKGAGIRAQKIGIDANRLEQWCLEHGHGVTSQTLADFVTICLREDG